MCATPERANAELCAHERAREQHSVCHKARAEMRAPKALGAQHPPTPPSPRTAALQIEVTPPPPAPLSPNRALIPRRPLMSADGGGGEGGGSAGCGGSERCAETDPEKWGVKDWGGEQRSAFRMRWYSQTRMLK